MKMERLYKLCRPLSFKKRVLTLLATLLGSMQAYAANLNSQQLQMLANNCVQCHSSPHLGAPIMGNPKQWKAVQRKSEDEILNTVIRGIGGMPPLGYCSACSEEDLRALIRVVAGLKETASPKKELGDGS